MGLTVDLDDLLDVVQVAELLGLRNQKGVSAYRTGRRRDGSRLYPDFPAPVLSRGRGQFLLWHRPEIEAWRAAHPSRPGRPRSGRMTDTPEGYL